MAPRIRRLGVEDVEAYLELRLHGLEQEEAGFRMSASEDRALPLAAQRQVLVDNVVFAGFEEAEPSRLLGMAGYRRLRDRKMRHKALLWGMYLRPEARGTGLSRALVQAVIDLARTEVESLLLTNTAGNLSASRLYERFGFALYGVEPNAIRLLDGRTLDEELRILRLS